MRSETSREWRTWLRANPEASPGSLGMLTGTDTRAMNAIAECLSHYAAGDDVTREACIFAIRHLLATMQPKCRPFVRALIPWALDWQDRDPLWQAITGAVVTQ